MHSIQRDSTNIKFDLIIIIFRILDKQEGRIMCLGKASKGTVPKSMSKILITFRILDKQEGRIMCLAWHPKGQYIVTGSADTIRVWAANTG